MKTYLIHLVRNGLTTGNTQGRYIGHTDLELSLDGEKQLKRLKEEMVYPPVEAVFSSPMKRCTKTAEILYPDQKPIILRDLIECNFGEFEGKTAQELENSPLFPRWLAGEDIEPPFGESNREFATRVCGCFEKIIEGVMKTGTQNTAVFTHGGVIMTLLAAYGLPEMPMHQWMTPNGCGFTIRVTPSVWMRGRKFEVIGEFPFFPESEEENYSDYEDDFSGSFFAIDLEDEEEEEEEENKN